MNLVPYLIEALLAIALIALMSYRQMTWRVIDHSRVFRLPVILGVIGVAELFGTAGGLGRADLAVLAVGIIVSLGVGAAMGAIAHFRRLSPQAAASYAAKRDGRSGATVEFESRTGWVGVLLWVVLIGVRIGIDLVARHYGAQTATSTGLVLILLAANRVARALVLIRRLDQHQAPVTV